ncbi:YraN family protein [Exilibacterium tricleocarpae]|uniref:UPF0102 protein FKG94_11095 n=1 Tax=Exilibacterium tricleocarpae TaxID=2591008 RepID=A0A545TSK9_9GAMM|nr:YraN family protein [Exilibacterium tricleocarpae]TQV80202.1 YraN family protein [Exilibacterium tricleocarpae]
MSTKRDKATAGMRGDRAEQRAQAYLISQGLQPVTRNYRCKAGEIDLIMRDGEVLVFVEVRLRSASRFGAAAATVTAKKQQKIIRTAAFFLQAHRLTETTRCRFDVIAFDVVDSAGSHADQAAPDNTTCDRDPMPKAEAGIADSEETHWFRDAFSAYN